MEALWIGYEEAEQLRDLLEGIAADAGAAADERVAARSVADGINPEMRGDVLATVARLLASAAGGGGLDALDRRRARHWADQIDSWLAGA